MPTRPPLVLASVAALVAWLPGPLVAREPTTAVQANRAAETELGRQLFVRDWLRPEPTGSPLAPPARGDGLGPLFNATSCVACHRQGGVGGAGPRENDVEVVSLVLPYGTSDEARAEATTRAVALLPAFASGSHALLHRFGRDPGGSFDAYERLRADVRGLFPEAPGPAAGTEVLHDDGLRYQLARRNTTALFGTGVIDAVPPDAIERVAAWQRAEFPDQAGRPSLGGAGRFGWRAQLRSLDAFTRAACADELGLRVRSTGRSVHDQAASPFGRRSAGPRVIAPVDMTEAQARGLVAFVRSLPAPRQVVSDDPANASVAAGGRRLFVEIGCAVCHVETLGPAEGVYSDLLLHDMGTALADRVKAPAPATRTEQVTSTTLDAGMTGGYYNERMEIRPRTVTTTITLPTSFADLEARTREWKTPPLWGVADSPPYLHDGRAPTLDEAIRGHGGQGEASVLRYAALDAAGRRNLLAFLGTLRTPTAH